MQDFVKQQQDYERGERIAERKLERDRIAAQEKERADISAERADKLATQEKDRKIELARIAAQEKERADKLATQEKDREIELARIAAQEKERADKLVTQEKDREIELARIAAQEAKADKDRELERDRIAAEEANIAANERLEMVRIEGIAEPAERDGELKRTELETDKESKLSSEIELEKLKHSFEMKHLELMGQLEVQRASFKTELQKQKSEKLAHARDPKLPYFEENKDKMDLSRFEKYATANKWDKNVWAAYLSALLKVAH